MYICVKSLFLNITLKNTMLHQRSMYQTLHIRFRLHLLYLRENCLNYLKYHLAIKIYLSNYYILHYIG